MRKPCKRYLSITKMLTVYEINVRLIASVSIIVQESHAGLILPGIPGIRLCQAEKFLDFGEHLSRNILLSSFKRGCVEPVALGIETCLSF